MSTNERRAFRAKRGDVKLAIFNLLKDGGYTGYGFMKKIRERSKGEWRVSSGSIYPQLDSLSANGLIQMRQRKSVTGANESYYVLTEAGRAHVRSNETAIARIWDSFKTPPAKKEEPLNPIEEELSKLTEAINILIREEPRARIVIINSLKEVRRSLYTHLASDNNS